MASPRLSPRSEPMALAEEQIKLWLVLVGEQSFTLTSCKVIAGDHKKLTNLKLTWPPCWCECTVPSFGKSFSAFPLPPCG